jgi:hypothetical protein
MDCMADCETMSTEPNAAILSIGLVAFDPLGSEISNSLHLHLSLDDSIRKRRHVSASTFLWWLEQSEEARRAIVDNQRSFLRPWNVVDRIVEFFDDNKISNIWSNGAASDIVWLQTFFSEEGETPPWTYKNVRCARTLFALCGDVLTRTTPSLEHDALSDAIAQAVDVQKAFRLLGARQLLGIR